MPPKKKRRRDCGCGYLSLGLAAAAIGWLGFSSASFGSGEPFYLRVQPASSMADVSAKLEERGVVRSSSAMRVMAVITRQPTLVSEGTYQFRPGIGVFEAFKALRRPISQSVRLPEGWWIARTAKRLEEKGVCSAEEYVDLAARPSEFKDVVSFPLPAESLEGYLYPDTYDLPPLLGARAVIERQLRAFETKVYQQLPEGTDLNRLLTIASMVELEAALDNERARIAGVLENRLRRRMRLQIDATVLYALQEWKQLGPGVVNTVDHPYNTYRIDGLPPGPIGSPAWGSIRAALEPERHELLYYMARPDRSHLFAADYGDHLSNIRRARAEWARQNSPN